MDRFNKMAHRKIMSLVKFLLIIATISQLSKSLPSTTVAEPSNYDDNRLGDGKMRVVIPEPFNFANLKRLKAKYELEGFVRALNNRNNKHHGNMPMEQPSFLPNINNNKLDEPSRGNEDDDDEFLLDKNDANQMMFDEIEMDGSRGEKDGQDEELVGDVNVDLPYGIQNVRRDLGTFIRSSRAGGNSRDKITFQSLCPFTKKRIDLSDNAFYEYRPHYYNEVSCFHSLHPSNSLMLPNKKDRVCTETGFSCIQLNRTVYFTRRARGSDCWESETRIVPSGCECMWPMHINGDIINFHQ